MKNENNAWKMAMGIGGGVAIGVCAIAAVAAAPVEIAATVAALGVTKWALNREDKLKDGELGNEPEEDLVTDA